MISHTSSDTLWLVGGDFNIICSLDEHRGPILPSFKGMEDFSSCIASCDLNNISPKGGIFTWHGKRSQGKVWRRLDRALVNTYAMNLYDDITLNHLSRSGSDHKPILLKGAINSYKGPKMFRFLNCWVSNDTFIPMVKLNWEKSSNVNGMSGFAEKLKILKTAIKEWNVSTFGDIFENVKMAEEEALARQNSFDNNPTEDNRAAANLASAKLLNACKREASYWFQKSNIKWMKEGESNSKFFHSVVKGKRAKLKITAIKDEEGVNHIDNNKIATLAVEHFTKLFEESPCKALQETLRFIPCTVTAEDNNSIKKLPSMEEVKQAVWSLNENAAPGPDGFNGFFSGPVGILSK
ncbi:unnamed protein product [Cuscuta campestris]|uniref:Endonuclease/exonuclease/phosphatase domain-containing protein n=1 Tax=Cuscuta campestris TaxID=132261 RepID=A0A484MXI4_9ASTE|nr:unnamed protein product [Cuscuta campestris]